VATHVGMGVYLEVSHALNDDDDDDNDDDNDGRFRNN